MTTDKVVLPSESADGFAHFSFDRDSKFIRFYLWLYEARASNINTCKLFWAYVFAPLALIVRAVVAVVRPLLDAINDHIPHKTEAQRDALWDEKRKAAREQRAAKAAAGPSKFERAIEKVSMFFSAAYAKAAPVLKYGGLAIGALLGLAAVASIIYAIITSPLTVLVAVVITAGLVLFIFGLFLCIDLIDKRSKAKGQVPFFSTMKKLFISFHRHTCAKVNLID